jgi:hypothetical protein
MGEIVIHDTTLVDRRLTSRVSPPRGLRKYFKTVRFFAHYDADIVADRSILNLPLVATVLPLAWLTGSNIYVEALDRTFQASMDALKHAFEKMYCNVHFNTKITAGTLVDNTIANVDPWERTALLFSGGVDSTYTLLTHRDLKPHLIMMWGVDNFAYPQHSAHWVKAVSTYSAFAERLRVPLHLIQTNSSQILHDRRIEHDFHKLLYDGTLRARLQHSLLLLPLVAPLSMGRFDRLFIAASNDPTHPYLRAPRAWASNPGLDEKIVWANVRVTHDGYIPRTAKITGAIKEYVKTDKLHLRVCTRSQLEGGHLNCGACEKCFRTILALIAAGIDPNACGFAVDDSTFHSIRSLLETEGLDTQSIESEWRPIAQLLHERGDTEYNGSKDFFHWFRSFDFNSTKKDVWLYRDIYNTLPYPISHVLDKIYSAVGIRIHDHSPLRSSVS